MGISSKRFSAEVIGSDGRETKISFSGQQTLMLIAHAEVIAPQIARLCDSFEQVDPNRGGFDEELTMVAIAQATMRLSLEIGTEEELFAHGVVAFTALTESWNRMNQLNFQHLAGLEPKSPEFLRRQVRLQQQEEQLTENREILSIFSQLLTKTKSALAKS